MRLYSSTYAAAVCRMTSGGVNLWIREGKVQCTEVIGLQHRIFTLPQLVALLDYAVEQAPIRWGRNCGARKAILIKNRKSFADMLEEERRIRA